MNALSKWIVWVSCSLVSLVVAAIPEIAMYFIWGIVQPTTELGRLLTMAVFVLGGGGLCFLFAVLGFMLFTATTAAILES